MEPSVRVATYNLYLGADLSLLLGNLDEAELAANRAEVQRQLLTTAFPSRVEAIARLLVRERLDLVGLQEVCTWHADGQPMWDFCAALLAALEESGEPYDVVVTQPTFEGAGKLPIGAEVVGLRVVGSNTILRRRSSPVQVGTTSVGLFEGAFSAPALGYVEFAILRGWCAARCTVAGRPFTLVDVHTEAYDEVMRNYQRDELLAALPQSGEPVVVVGDFNSTPDRVGMPTAFVDAWLAAGSPDDPVGSATCCQAADLSNEESSLDERIDYVWVRGARVQSCRRFGADPDDRTASGLWPSDHAGVSAQLLLG